MMVYLAAEVPMKTVLWSPFEVHALHALAKKERSIKAIAYVMKRSLDAVYSKTRSEKCPVRTNPRWSQTETDLLKGCTSLEEAVTKTGRTEVAVFNKAKRLGVKLDCKEFFKRRNHA
jgi:hypothetical protein